MIPVFLDTQYLLALANTRDQFHTIAQSLRPKYRQGLLTTEYILLEVLDALTVGAQRALALKLVDSINADPAIEVLAASPTLLKQGIELFQRHADKEWGITDCISFCAMRQCGMTDALTADHHFEQAGFRALLRT